MSEVKIFDNIPVPSAPRGGRPARLLDFAQLAPGQSVFRAANEGEEVKDAVSRIRGQVSRWRKADESRKDMVFTVAAHPIPDDPLGTTGVGIWRTA